MQLFNRQMKRLFKTSINAWGHLSNFLRLLMISGHKVRLLSAFTIAAIPMSVVKTPIFELQQRFHPLFAQHAIVATQQSLASIVGRDILKAGGNAVDAAVGIGFALAVTLPRAGNLGGGGFMMVWLAKEHKAIAIDYREQAPKKISAQDFITDSGEINTDKLHNSYASAGVPGTVAGFLLAHERYGHLPLAQIINPAIKLAENGFSVDANLAHALFAMQTRLRGNADAQKIFFHDKRPLRMGERLKQPELAATLKLIAKFGTNAFYKGAIAKQIIATMNQHGGVISQADLSAYHARILKPVEGEFAGFRILSMPPPSSGGITLIEILNILSSFPLHEIKQQSAHGIHLMCEAMNYAYRDRNHFLGDDRFITIPKQRLLSKSYAKAIAKKVNLQQHIPAKLLANEIASIRESNQTTHFSVVDKDGNMVANTYTLNYSFGSGKMVAGAGFFLNNELDDFTIIPGRANSFGLVQGKNNLIAAGRRPLSSMTPTLVINHQGQAVMALGSPGGSRIITTVLQILVNKFIYQQNIATAINLPRIHCQLWPDKLFIEQGVSPDTQALLYKMGHTVVTSRSMGASQVVAQKPGFVVAAADPRRPGALASGY